MALSKVDLANQVENQLPQNLVANNLPFRNIIINGDMSIAQRGTSATGLGNGDSGYHTVDRWSFWENATPTYEFTMSQDTDVPSGQGFAYSLKMDCTTAATSLSAAEAMALRYKIEGQNLQYLKYGSSNAESITMSFWVKSNKTGTYIVNIFATNEISKAYTINSSNTWEKKTITFDANTTDTISNNNSTGLNIYFLLLAGTDRTSGTLNTSWNSPTNANRAVGQVNLADSTSNYINITGVQLEVGSAASDFEFLPVDVNLNRCFRYYYKYCEGSNSSLGLGGVHFANQVNFSITFPTQMRANPTVDQVSGTDYYTFYHNTSDGFNGIDSIQDEGKNQQTYLVYTNISATAGECGIVYGNNASAYLAADAEL